MSTLRQLKVAARRHGAAVVPNEDGSGCDVVAPNGKVWADTSSHAIAAFWREPQWKAEAVDEALELMTSGLVDCDDPDCDCYEKE